MSRTGDPTLGRVPDLPSALSALAAIPSVAEGSERAREACTRLRWHPALRRREPEAAAESRVRGAWASAELDGARSTVEIVRDFARGARTGSVDPDPAEQVLLGALAATTETERVRGVVLSAPRQAMARLHVAAAAPLLDHEAVGRPRRSGEECLELTEVGPAPSADVVAARLSGLVDVVAEAPRLPAVVVAAVVHAEIATLRPFVRGNGVVARAMERALVQAGGLDVTAVAVPEVGHGADGGRAYVGALAAYATGSRGGVELWLTHCAEALERGADEGRRIADAVLAGRLT